MIESVFSHSFLFPGAAASVMMPSGSTYPVVAMAAAAAAAAATGPPAATTAVVPAGTLAVAGAANGFALPHPGDGSMDFTKTEMVTPETSLNMSMGAFLASLGLEQLREIFDRYEHFLILFLRRIH